VVGGWQGLWGCTRVGRCAKVWAGVRRSCHMFPTYGMCWQMQGEVGRGREVWADLPGVAEAVGVGRVGQKCGCIGSFLHLEVCAGVGMC
jgi:hypothetical protein